MRREHLVPLVLGGLLVGFTACGSDDSGASGSGSGAATEAATPETVLANYADGVFASYAATVVSATAMDTAVDAFIAEPNDDTLAAARQAWLTARDDYGPTEAFRFSNGPIDNDASGTEGLINAWPMDEAYVDYVEGAPEAGIVNDPTGYPVIDADLLLSSNEAGGETNISTGWHAIEFLLWGQDLNADGPGDRPAADYVDAPNADRRATYLATASDLLVGHLTDLAAAWDPAATDNYRAEFLALDPDEALTNIVTGIGELSRGELASQRMNVAYTERSQEDEHSCFSDNTVNDFVNNTIGIQQVLTGSYPGGVSGPGLLDLIADDDAEVAEQLRTEVQASVDALRAIPAPFDQHLRDGVPDSDPGRMAVLAGIEALEQQTVTIVDAADRLGLSVNVS
jgi:putative iron-regulated protein